MSGKQEGFTLVELIASLTLLSVILGAMFSVVVRTQRTYLTQREVLRDQENLRVAELLIRSVLRSAGAEPRATNQLLINPDPLDTNSWDNVRIRADHNPANGSFSDALEDVILKVQNDTLFVRLQASANYEPYVYPIRSMMFYWHDSSGTHITTEAGVSEANQVRVVLTAPPHPITGEAARRETWIFLRNRR